MTKSKPNTTKKGARYSSFEEMKAKVFPNLARKEEQEQLKQDPKLLGVIWANESIDNILSS